MSSLQAFPAIKPNEFTEACKALKHRCVDNINKTDWLSVRWTGEELRLKQRRKIACVQNSRGTIETEEEELIEEVVEDSMVDRIPLTASSEHEFLLVDFSIVLSPTYSVPVLWFSCRHASNSTPLNLDEVYKYLVPTSLNTSLRGIGVMGGISLAVKKNQTSVTSPADKSQYHPVTDLPMFFLHPCNTQEALLVLRPDTTLNPEAYLMLWLGMMGSSVGLHIPSKLLSK